MYRIEGPEDGGKAPNGPNFLLIVGVFLAAIAACFVLALLLIPAFGRHIHMIRPDKHPTSQLLVGASNQRLA